MCLGGPIDLRSGRGSPWGVPVLLKGRKKFFTVEGYRDSIRETTSKNEKS